MFTMVQNGCSRSPEYAGSLNHPSKFEDRSYAKYGLFEMKGSGVLQNTDIERLRYLECLFRQLNQVNSCIKRFWIAGGSLTTIEAASNMNKSTASVFRTHTVPSTVVINILLQFIKTTCPIFINN